MNLNLHEHTIEWYKPIYNKGITKEETVEAIVSDTLPDVEAVVDTQFAALIRGKEAESGRVTVSGILTADIVYVPENGGEFCRHHVEHPFSVQDDCVEISQSCRIVSCVTILKAETVILNSRKLQIRAELKVDTACYASEKLPIHDLTAEEAEPAALVLKAAEHNISYIRGITEKTFVLEDVYTPQIDEVLHTDAVLSCEEIQRVGTKLIVKAAADLTLMGVRDGDLVTEKFTVPFSQILETDWESECADADVKMMLTGIYTNSSDELDSKSGVAVEIHGVIQCVCCDTAEIKCVEDLYSTKYETEMKPVETNMIVCGPKRQISGSFRENIEIHDPVERVITVSASAGEAVRDENTILPVYVHLCYLSTDGTVHSLQKRFAFQVNDPACLEAGRALSCVVKDAVGAISANGVEVRAGVQICCREMCERQISSVSQVSWDETVCIDVSEQPSVVLRRVGAGESLWQIARDYHSAPEMIRAVNHLENDRLPEKCMLLIPKIRNK